MTPSLLVLTILLSQTQGHPTAAKVYSKAAPSVVLVEAWTLDGTTQGSGVVVAPGLIVTNNHVVQDAQGFILIHQNEQVWRGEVQAMEPTQDLALVAIILRRGEKFTPVPVKRRAALKPPQIGESVFAIGAPLGLEQTLSVGIVSGLPEIAGERLMQTDAAISRGSSGGGLFDVNGELVGITTAYLAEGQSLNFAVPAQHISALENRPPLWSETPHTALPPKPLIISMARKLMSAISPSDSGECPKPPELPLPLGRISAVVIDAKTSGPLLTAGDMTADWVRARVTSRLKNHGIFVFSSMEEAQKAERYAVTLKIEISSLNIRDTVFYPWQVEINVVDTTNLAGGGRGKVNVLSYATFGYGGSDAVLKQVTDLLDETVSELANMLNK